MGDKPPDPTSYLRSLCSPPSENPGYATGHSNTLLFQKSQKSWMTIMLIMTRSMPCAILSGKDTSGWIQSKPAKRGTRKTGHPSKWGVCPKNWFRPTQMTPAKRGDIRKTGRGAWPIVIFCIFIYCFGPLSVFLGYLSSSHMADAQMRPAKRPRRSSSHSRNARKFSPNSMQALWKEHLPTNSVWAKAASDGLRPTGTISSMPRTLCPPTRWKSASRSSLSYSTRTSRRLWWSSWGWLETADWW